MDSAMTMCGQHLIAIYIFGGVAKGYFSKDVSDVDLLFIVSDDCSEEVVNMLENRLIHLEAKYEPEKAEGTG
jgi:predicted nucleotidyltransferase